ncbi:class I SAM-dependent methyltransferase [Aquimarina sp. AD10]|uniref:class I SAM-dependent methyltransferase n=1 Tax=Aquimarina sp. AD10 TaxID=1714849 RepID=UPI000E4D822B|nr:class I SAM-dependent methyltransferase [Aquimarina sp. AD10]AXT61826.1 class I SAM-dependent methyltransferase [Aquimarina sp. AD10]RKN02624.1 methyltransferase domain-containing protein [Aquimarina sp. AD10]
METKTVEKRLEDEQKFHNEIFENETRKSVGKFYSINKNIHKTYENLIFKNPKEKVFLEYGCGMAEGNRLVKLAKKGAVAHGIDISDFAINHLSQEAKKEGLDIDYKVMNAEEMTFEDNRFDIIYGAGILHHLDLEKSYQSISKKLKKSGEAIFIEPLGHNYLINNFRNKTPDIRTEDEHPLMMEDFKLAKKYFGKVKIQHFFLSTLALPILFKSKSPKFLIDFFDGFDKVIFTVLPFLKKYSWQVVVRFSDPK